MCFMLYLASDKSIQLVVWNKENPQVGFNNPVTEPKCFSKKNIYFVNSTQCCGCGFRQETDVFHPDFSEIEEKNTNQLQLYKYLKSFLENQESIELFGCWAGSEYDLKEERTIQVDDLIKSDFYFVENELVKITK